MSSESGSSSTEFNSFIRGFLCKADGAESAKSALKGGRKGETADTPETRAVHSSPTSIAPVHKDDLKDINSWVNVATECSISSLALCAQTPPCHNKG